MRLLYWLPGLAVLALLCGVQLANAQGKDTKKVTTFKGLETLTEDVAQAKAQAWFKAAVKNDAAQMAKFKAIWAQQDHTILERVAATLELGDAEAARLLRAARDPQTPAPKTVDPVFGNAKLDAFYRANLGLAYARSLSNRRIHEEALEILKGVNVNEVVDPAAYLFHRAVCEHALLQKADATGTIVKLIREAVDAPERFKTVSALMLLDMQTWKEKDLAAIARKMDNVERRLELARGGPQTQKIQKEIISRLDELIKELENQANSPGGS